MDARELAQRLAENAVRVAEYLLPNGKKKGPEWRVGSVLGEAGDSLGVHLSGTKAGVWSDFASGEAGDLLDLWVAARAIPLTSAIREAKDFLGISDPTLPDQKRYAKPKPIDARKPKGAALAWLESRGITQAAIDAYRIGITTDGSSVVFPFFRDGELRNWKRRNIADKKDMAVSPGAEPCLFGWQAIPENARTVTVCEGEIDALTLWQYGKPALSVQSGAKNLAWVDTEFPHLERFSEIFLCLDNDKDGKDGTALILDRLGRERCRVVTLPKKDANECLLAGIEADEIDEFFQNAQSIAPSELRCAAEYEDEVIREFYPLDDKPEGIFLPWPKTFGEVQVRKSELLVWTGTTGHGKSLLLGQAMVHAMEQGERVCIASLELKPKKLLYRIARQMLGDSRPSTQEIHKAMDWLSSRLWVFDHVGEAKLQVILDTFMYARKRFGVTQFVVDNLMMLDVAEDDYEGQRVAVTKMAAFKNDHECCFHLVAHARKGKDESMAPNKLDIKGAGTIANLADTVFSVWRNKRKETHDLPYSQEPCAVLYVDKQRNGEWEGKIVLWFNTRSFQYLQEPFDQPTKIDFASHEANYAQVVV